MVILSPVYPGVKEEPDSGISTVNAISYRSRVLVTVTLGLMFVELQMFSDKQRRWLNYSLKVITLGAREADRESF